MSDKRTLTIGLSGASGCGKTRVAAMLQYLFDQAEIEVIHQSGDPVQDHDDKRQLGENLLNWLKDNVKVVIVDYRV